MKRILFYSDSKQTGGHEIMAIEAIKGLSVKYEIFIVISSFNKILCERLKNISNTSIYKIDYCANRFQIINNLFSYKIKSELKKIVIQKKPDLCIAIQGSIDTSFLILNICKNSKIKCVSYMPFASDLRKVSKHKFIGLIKDIIQLRYYHVPDYFITINDMFAKQIALKSKNNNIFIVKNGIEFNNYTRYNKISCRNKYGIPEDSFVVGFIGRIELWHKGLDYYIYFLNKYADEFVDVVFLFVGSGSKNAEKKLEQVVRLKKNVKYFSWTDNVSEFYSSIDCYIQPSRFEGFPITMIEALFFYIPILASNIPAVSWFLPKDNLFKIKDYNQMDIKIKAVKNGKIGKINFNHDDFSIDTFKEKFSYSVELIFNDKKCTFT
jgi:glycosyltransferase involved in cell wall biosynthesis